MATNYNFKGSDTIKSNTITVIANTGVLTSSYSAAFQNAPITIISIKDTSSNVIIGSSCVYDASISGFTTITTTKVADGDGGIQYYQNATKYAVALSGNLYYFSIDNNAFSNYKYNGYKTIQSGTFTITVNDGKATTNFGSTFQNTPIVVVCPTGNVNDIISCIVTSTTASSFSVLSFFKDGANNQSGGGAYYSNSWPGTFNYVAVDATASSTYKYNGAPIIKCGTFTITTSNGYTTVTGLGFQSGNVYVFCSPTGSFTGMVSYIITEVSLTKFSVFATYKDSAGGGSGGGLYYGAGSTFNYIAINV